MKLRMKKNLFAGVPLLLLSYSSPPKKGKKMSLEDVEEEGYTAQWLLRISYQVKTSFHSMYHPPFLSQGGEAILSYPSLSSEEEEEEEEEEGDLTKISYS